MPMDFLNAFKRTESGNQLVIFLTPLQNAKEGHTGLYSNMNKCGERIRG